MGKRDNPESKKTPKEQLAEVFGWICWYCGESFTDRQLVKDHIIPRSKGGRDDLENRALACRKCDRLKGNRNVWEFIEKDRPHAPIKERLIKMGLKKRKT